MIKYMEHLISYSTKKLKDAQKIVRFRRINWTVVSKEIEEDFSEFVESCIKNKFPYRFKVATFNEHPNECSIEIRCVSYPKTKLTKLNPSSNENPNIFEKGGNLVVSQGHEGLVLFMFTPLSTDKVDLNFREVLISPPLDPRKIDTKYLNNILKRYLLLIRFTSLYGNQTLTLFERLKISLIFIMDIRHKYDLVRSIISMKNEWAKLVVAALLGSIFTYYVFTPSVC